MNFFDSLKDKVSQTFKGNPNKDDYELSGESTPDEYLEVGGGFEEHEKSTRNVIIRPFILVDFEDIKDILQSLREGNTICLINIKPLKEKDMIELKRAINKLRKTCDAIGGDIAGFGDENWVVVTPKMAEIYKSKQMEYFEE